MATVLFAVIKNVWQRVAEERLSLEQEEDSSQADHCAVNLVKDSTVTSTCACENVSFYTSLVKVCTCISIAAML